MAHDKLVGLPVETGGIGGQTLWGPLPDAADCFILWPGVGSRLYLAIRPHAADGAMVPIDHPTANGAYETRRDAARAVAAFVAASAE